MMNLIKFLYYIALVPARDVFLADGAAMTLILSRASKEFVLQVGDRLITVAGNVYDPVSNKTVVLLARDGVASVSYTGIAFVGPKTTDTFMAECILGEATELDGITPTFSNVPGVRHSVGVSGLLWRLYCGIQKEWPKLHWRERRYHFEVAVVGWRHRDGRILPFHLRIFKNYDGVQFSIERAVNRYRYLENIVSITQAPSYPNGYLRQSHVRAFAMAEECKYGSTAEKIAIIENVFVETIRQIADKTGLVGHDPISIVMPPHTVGEMTIKFIPLKPFLIKFPDDDEAYSSMCTPWIITPNGYMAPSFVTRPKMTYHSGSFRINIEGPVISSNVTFTGSQPRRSRP